MKFQPYKYSLLLGDIELQKKCQETAEKFKLDVKDIDLTDDEIKMLLENKISGFCRSIQRADEIYFKKLYLVPELEWPFFQTILRFELLSGVIEKQLIFGYNSKLVKDKFLEVRQQYNTLKMAIDLSDQTKGLTLSPATVELESKYTKCIIGSLNNVLYARTMGNNKFIESFQDDKKKLIQWFQTLKEDKSLLDNANFVTKTGQEKTIEVGKLLLTLSAECKLYHRKTPCLFGIKDSRK